MAVLGRTIAVLNKIIEDIKLAAHVITIIASCIFLGYYAYSAVINIEHLFFLIIYSAFFVISLILFIIYLATYSKKNKKKTFQRVLRIIRYVLNAAVIGFNVYNVATTTTSDLNLILLIVSVISWLAQIIIEIIRVCFERYVDLLKTAFEMDLEFVYKIAKLKEGKTSIYGIIDAPLEAWANKIQGIDPEEKLTKQEQYVEDLAAAYEQTRKEKEDAKKEATKMTAEETIQKEKNDIKEHLGIIGNNLKEKVSGFFKSKKDE